MVLATQRAVAYFVYLRRLCLSSALLLAMITSVPCAYADDYVMGHSENFTISGEMTEEQADEIIRELETFRANSLRLFGARNMPEALPINIIVVRNGADMERATGNAGLGSRVGNTLGGLYIVIKRNRRNVVDDVLFGSYYGVANNVLHHVDGAAPPYWYRHGFGQYMSSFEYKEGHIMVGASRESVGLALDRDWIRMEDVLSAVFSLPEMFGTIERLNSNYPMLSAQSWLLVHYIRSTAGMDKKYADYLARIHKGEPYIPAFEAAFGMSVDQLTAELRRYYGANRLAVQTYKTPVGPERFTPYIKGITKTKAHENIAMAAAYLYKGDDYGQHIIEEFSEVRSNQGFSPYVAMGLAAGSFHEARRGFIKNYLRRALDNAAGVPDIELLVGRLMVKLKQQDITIDYDTSMPTARTHLAKVFAKDADNPHAHYYNALSYSLQGRVPDDGVKSAHIALDYYAFDFMAVARLNMAMALARGADYMRAETIARSVLEGGGNDRIKKQAQAVLDVIDKGAL